MPRPWRGAAQGKSTAHPELLAQVVALVLDQLQRRRELRHLGLQELLVLHKSIPISARERQDKFLLSLEDRRPACHGLITVSLQGTQAAWCYNLQGCAQRALPRTCMSFPASRASARSARSFRRASLLRQRPCAATTPRRYRRKSARAVWPLHAVWIASAARCSLRLPHATSLTVADLKQRCNLAELQ